MNALLITTIILSASLIASSAPVDQVIDDVATGAKGGIDAAADAAKVVNDEGKNFVSETSAAVADLGNQASDAVGNAGDQLLGTVTEANNQVDKAAEDLLNLLGDINDGAKDGLKKGGLGGAVAGAVGTAGKDLGDQTKKQADAVADSTDGGLFGIFG